MVLKVCDGDGGCFVGHSAALGACRTGELCHVFAPPGTDPGVRMGEADLALAFARPTSIGGASASSPPSPMIMGGLSTN